MTRGAAIARLALASVLALVPVPPGAAGELRRVEAVGAVALGPDALHGTPPRDAARRAALAQAVRRVATDLLPSAHPLESDAVLAEVLGDDPLEFVARFRILEDRGERPALFVSGAEREYVVRVEAFVAEDRVRSRLVRAGLLDRPSGDTRRVRLRVVLEDVPDYAAYAALRQLLLEQPGVRSALPVALEPGRAVLEVETDRGARALLPVLRRGTETLSVTPLDSDAGTLRLRVHRVAPQEPAPALASPRGAPGSAPIDTPNSNRY